jgi:multidrug efflux pump subunit AcrB
MKEIGLEVQDYFMQFVDDDPDRFDRSETEVPAIRYLNTRISAGGFRIISEPVRPADIDELMDAITAKYREYPGMRAFAARGSIISSNDGGTRSINLDVSGPNLGVIYAAALATYRRAEDVFGNPRIQTSPSSLSLSQPMLEVQPDWARAAELGLTAGDVGYTVAALTDGAFVDEYFEADDKIDMYLYGTTGGQTDVDNLGGLPIYTPQGSILPLDAIATIHHWMQSPQFTRPSTLTRSAVSTAREP